MSTLLRKKIGELFEDEEIEDFKKDLDALLKSGAVSRLKLMRVLNSSKRREQALAVIVRFGKANVMRKDNIPSQSKSIYLSFLRQYEIRLRHQKLASRNPCPE